MKRQGLSGNNSRRQEPSQTIWARTLWWMRWALSSHLPPEPLVSNPLTSVCSLPFHLSPLHNAGLRVSRSFLLQQPSSKPNKPTRTNDQSHHSQIPPSTLCEDGRCTRVSEIISRPNSESPSWDKRDCGFESIGTGPWPLPPADPWGGLLHHNEGQDRACLWMIRPTLLSSDLEAEDTPCNNQG